MMHLTPKPQDALSLLPKSSSPEHLEGFKQILTCTSFPTLLEVDLTTYPQTWSLFQDLVLAKSDSWCVPARSGPLADMAGRHLFHSLRLARLAVC
jgi:hypothetical protein